MLKTCPMIAIFLFIASIVSFVVFYKWSQSYIHTDIKTEEECKSFVKDGECGVWLSDTCWKGDCEGPHDPGVGCACKKKAHYGPVLLLVAGAVALIASLVFTVLSFTRKKSVKTRHSSSFGFKFY